MLQTIAHHQLAEVSSVPGLVQCLSGFREYVESEFDGSFEELSVPAVLLLSDLCAYLELPDADRDMVLGKQGVAAVDRICKQTITLTGL